LVGLAISSRWRAGRSPAAQPAANARPPRSIAVLPFDNLNRDSTTDYFGDGIADELISALGRIGGLRVASRTSTFAMKRKNGPRPEVAKRLGVEAVLESSLLRDGDNIRIRTRLVHVARDSVLWD